MRVIFNRRCNECKSDKIMLDELKGEVFCLDCGLVLEERFQVISIPDIIDYMKIMERKEREKMMKSLE